jgi:hypothetical protein
MVLWYILKLLLCAAASQYACVRTIMHARYFLKNVCLGSPPATLRAVHHLSCCAARLLNVRNLLCSGWPCHIAFPVLEGLVLITNRHYDWRPGWSSRLCRCCTDVELSRLCFVNLLFCTKLTKLMCATVNADVILDWYIDTCIYNCWYSWCYMHGDYAGWKVHLSITCNYIWIFGIIHYVYYNPWESEAMHVTCSAHVTLAVQASWEVNIANVTLLVLVVN